AGNSLIDLQHPASRGERFDLAFGKSGGEDTDFFDRIYRNGGRFDYAATALVTERLAVDRQNLAWFLRRRYRSGQTHGRTLARRRPLRRASPPGHPRAPPLARRNQGRDRLPQIAKAAIKAGICFAMTIVTLPAPVTWRRWLLRGALHAGVVARLFGQREAA